jgi:hypothetical protein
MMKSFPNQSAIVRKHFNYFYFGLGSHGHKPGPGPGSDLRRRAGTVKKHTRMMHRPRFTFESSKVMDVQIAVWS